MNNSEDVFNFLIKYLNMDLSNLKTVEKNNYCFNDKYHLRYDLTCDELYINKTFSSQLIRIFQSRKECVITDFFEKLGNYIPELIPYIRDIKIKHLLNE